MWEHHDSCGEQNFWISIENFYSENTTSEVTKNRLIHKKLSTENFHFYRQFLLFCMILDYKFLTNNSLISGDDGLGASADIILPSLSNRMNLGIDETE